MKRIININTHEFIRDIDLNYDTPNSSYVDEFGVKHERTNEVAIEAPACCGSNRRWSYDLNRWIN